MKRFILFDVDGTLIESPPSTVQVTAIREHFDLEVSLAGVRTGGMTEQEILTLLLNKEIKSAMPGLLKTLDVVCAREFQPGSTKLLPGVEDLLDALDRLDATLGLITGNLKSRAELKLRDVGIWHYFSVGGYGDDPHEMRSDLVRLACERAGFRTDDLGVYVIGDTWRDIKAAVEAGVGNRVGLIGPRHPKEEFEEAGANIVLSSFVETEKVLEAFGIPSAELS